MIVQTRLLGPIQMPDECLVWRGAHTPDGYGRIAVGVAAGQTERVHKRAWEQVNGPVPVGLVLDHLCRNRACWNVGHLEAVTVGTNIRRGLTGEVARQRQLQKTHCRAGHPFTPENTYRPPSSNKRMCRTCVRERHRWYDHLRREEDHRHGQAA